ncbi:NAD(P)-dependent oxidoreductase [Microlunatus soli]|uniref:3-hydroxyisobutyrate dehydrogenase n=1 Tax=Microlunatus soli TaxID=630515 RepID=A0A1H1MIA3_9ACTN|nr:NAD(P)-dependent oxidoreductase [Microlunatus soli]SDR86456.1 3-hydroxyisobutyrate dehydrogenase [Microlunatus soli]
MQSTKPTVGVIGLGAMGRPAAAALARRFPVAGYDPVRTALDAAVQDGVVGYDSPAATAAAADLIVLSLPTPAVVRSVVDDLGRSADGKIIADLSTIDPGTAREVAAALEPSGTRYLDAPVLGRPASCGNWTLPCGGDETAVEAFAEVAIGTIAAAVERVGTVGSGATLKVCNNLMFASINTITAEVVDLAERAGVDPAVFARVVGGSGAATVSGLFNDIAPRMAEHRYADPTFAIRLLAKDVGLGAELAASLQRDLPVTRIVKDITDCAVRQGLGDLDTAAVVETYRDQPTLRQNGPD